MNLSTEISFLGILLVSLMGSTHCAGMCGGFVLLYSGESKPAEESGKKSPVSFLVHALYHFGRLTTYLVLGALAGFVGKSFNEAATLVGVQQATLLLTGAFLLVWGVKLLFFPSVASLAVTDSLFGRTYKKTLGLIMSNTRASQHRRAFLLGLLTTLLPCGWLWVYVVFASGTGSPLTAMLIMFFFWLGTVPILTCLGVFNRFLSGRLRSLVPRASGLAMVCAGILSLLLHAGFDLGLHDHHSHMHMSADETQSHRNEGTQPDPHSEHHHMH